MQAPFTASLIPIRVAATAPVSLVLPVACAHSPTFSAAEVAGTVCRYLVADVTSTVSVTDAPEARFWAVTVMVLPVTAATCPDTAPPKPPKPPPVPVRVPLGRLPDGKLDGRPDGAPVPAPRRAVHDPFTGAVIVTVVAVMVTGVPAVRLGALLGALEAPDVPPVGVATAVMHDPLVTAASVTLCCWVKVVLDV